MKLISWCLMVIITRSICFYMYSEKFKKLSLEIKDNSENLAIEMMKNARKLATPCFFVFSFHAGV